MTDRGTRAPAVRNTSLARAATGLGVAGGLLWAGSGVLFLSWFVWRDGSVGGALSGVFLRAVGLTCLFMLAGLWGVSRIIGLVSGRGGRYGAPVSAVGLLLVLPATVVPSGSASPSLSRLLPVVFFAGIAALVVGNALLGTSIVRHRVAPAAIGVPLAVALPGGVVLGFLVATATGEQIAVPVGATIPFGLAWTALCGYVWWTARHGSGPRTAGVT